MIDPDAISLACGSLNPPGIDGGDLIHVRQVQSLVERQQFIQRMRAREDRPVDFVLTQDIFPAGIEPDSRCRNPG